MFEISYSFNLAPYEQEGNSLASIDFSFQENIKFLRSSNSNTWDTLMDENEVRTIFAEYNENLGILYTFKERI